MSSIYFNIINNTAAFQNLKSDDVCLICRDNLIDEDPLEQMEIVNHINDGEKHPFHLECIKDYAKVLFQNKLKDDINCPGCQISIKIQGLTNKAINVQWIFKTVMGSLNFGFSTWAFLAKVPYPITLGFIGPTYYSLEHLYKTEEKIGAIIGTAVGTIVGSAVISGPSSILASTLENQEETCPLNGDTSNNALMMVACISMGTGLGQYVQRKYFS